MADIRRSWHRPGPYQARDHRPRRRRPAARRRGDRRCADFQRRDLRLSRARCRVASQRHRLARPLGYRSLVSADPPPWGAAAPSPASTACSHLPFATARAARFTWCATGSAKSRFITASPTASSCSPPRRARCCRHPAFCDAEPDRLAAYRHLLFEYLPRSGSGWAGIAKLEPGTILTFAGGRTSRERYWRPRLDNRADRTSRGDRDAARVAAPVGAPLPRRRCAGRRLPVGRDRFRA